MTDYPEPVISDGNFDYFNKNPEDYKSIVLKCIQEILKINSNLLSKTGKVYFKVEGQVLEKEENTKKIYYQLINLLEDLLLYAFDDKAEKDIKEQDEKLKAELKELRDNPLSEKIKIGIEKALIKEGRN